MSSLEMDSSILSSSSTTSSHACDTSQTCELKPKTSKIASVVGKISRRSTILRKTESKKDIASLKNQITEDDFPIKKQEFTKWLAEEKKLQLDKLDGKRCKVLFQSFVKKWNKRKLPAHYYRETESLWVVMSPVSPKVTRSKSSGSKLNSRSTSLRKIVEDSPLQPYTPSPPSKLAFGTFGKKAGARMLTELRAAERMQNLRSCSSLIPRISSHDDDDFSVCDDSTNVERNWSVICKPPRHLPRVQSTRQTFSYDPVIGKLSTFGTSGSRLKANRAESANYNIVAK